MSKYNVYVFLEKQKKLLQIICDYYNNVRLLYSLIREKNFLSHLEI